MSDKTSLTSPGFTMIELIVVALLIGILASSIMIMAPNYFLKRRDNQRKVDLSTMKVAFEDYANDHTCYPPENDLQDCGDNTLSPYLIKVPCDPSTNQPYTYVLGSDCRSYELYTTLENTDDPDIEEVGCASGCGPNNDNYGVVGGGALLDR